MRLQDYLSVPYLLEAETVELAPGSWISRVAIRSYPAAPLKRVVVEDALRLLERNADRDDRPHGRGRPAAAGAAAAAAGLRSGLGRQTVGSPDEIMI